MKDDPRKVALTLPPDILRVCQIRARNGTLSSAVRAFVEEGILASKEFSVELIKARATTKK